MMHRRWPKSNPCLPSSTDPPRTSLRAGVVLAWTRMRRSGPSLPSLAAAATPSPSAATTARIPFPTVLRVYSSRASVLMRTTGCLWFLAVRSSSLGVEQTNPSRHLSETRA
ncbi:hypothetical protein GQ55_1G155600 [Panicum hallii var. hallii]|uniref:Uncharacterized protein n=1 Tax=Panicum hallii var. hallii TaxID=1504633 RepID=A0A2T7F5K3_9POAL|nr:hypothetical protein GQ55_1G155600 [Panicum hallii var. hallii]PUZ75341.1 hypothetical protein GQ55_1G155600 [Panicum hallii var. hallii]PUZ75342.1 hypothetical protein GQ55_1G155600 [Panicum hallii var. hallii]PUZ75343.1 hypothetical protein GQ55_1G155600 [Panicum hallii var. hallii]PUZ75344.1 hypothetical protein GQ55_1G155600 [Panicum hallii var. hallii]